MPLSLVGDTLFLPCDWYYIHEKKLDQEFRKHSPPVLPDPLAGWKRVFPAQPDQAIVQDYQDYIEKLPPLEKQTFRTKQFGVWFYEDGDGSHAVAIPIPLDGTSWQHDLFYDENNHRTKAIKYAAGYYRK